MLKSVVFSMSLFLKLLMCVTLVVNGLMPYEVVAHETETDDSIPFERIYAAILESASQLEFEEVPEGSHNFETYLRGSKKYVVVGPRQYVKVDNAFKGLVENIGRLYIAEFEQACEECILPSLESLTNEALAQVAKGWFSENAKKAKEILAYRYAGAFVTLGGRYGPTAGMIKLVGEFMEEIMLAVFKMPGAHMFCEVITAAIAVYAGKTNTFMRAYGLSEHSNISGPLKTPRALARLLATSFVMRRAMKRMAIGVQNFEINQDELRHFVDEEKEDKTMYRIRNWVGKKFRKESEDDSVKDHHRVVKFLNHLEKKVAKVSAKSFEDEKANAMYFKDIKRKSYYGNRYGWAFLLKKRRQRDSLSQFADHSASITNSRGFWLVGLKQDILDPLTNPKELKTDFENQPKMTVRLDIDSVTQRQMESYSSNNPTDAEAIFRSLDAITDYEGRTMGQRRIELAFLQSYLSDIMPRLLNKMVESVLNQYSDDEKKLMKVYHLYYRIGEITFLAEQFVDFLRFAAVAKSSTDPFLKYHIRDYYLKINEAMSTVASFEGARTLDDMVKFISSLKEKITDLKKERFWVEKKNKIGFLPSAVSNMLDNVFHPIRKTKERIHHVEDLYDFGKDNFRLSQRYKRPKYYTGAPSCESLYL